MIEKLEARLIEKQNLAGSFWIFKLEFEQDFLYEAGQYVSVKVNEAGLRRSYSIASRPNGKLVELLIDVSPGGPGSMYFSNVKVGDKVEIMGPVGKFVVRKNDMPKLFVATGSGIAPIRAMVQECDGLNLKRRLVWGMRYETDLFWQDLGAELVLSKPGDGWRGKVGHVGDLVDEDLTGWEVYLCGNEKMVAEMVEKILKLGVLESAVFFEKFG